MDKFCSGVPKNFVLTCNLIKERVYEKLSSLLFGIPSDFSGTHQLPPARAVVFL